MDKSWGKFYAKTFEGSMFGAGSTIFAVWSYCIAKARPPSGTVELNPKMLSCTLGDDEQKIIDAINYLQADDPNSRSTTYGGKRLIRIGQYEYQLVNFTEHRNGIDDEERKRYFREKQRQYRSNVKRNVSDSSDTITQAEAEAEAEADTERSLALQKDPSTSQDSPVVGGLKTTSSASGKQRRRGAGGLKQTPKPKQRDPHGDAFKTAFDAVWPEPYAWTKADFVQLAKFREQYPGVDPPGFVAVAKACWECGAYCPQAALSIKGLCAKWAQLAAKAKLSKPQDLGCDIDMNRQIVESSERAMDEHTNPTK